MRTTRHAHQSTGPGEWLIHAHLAGDPRAKAVLESYRVPFWAPDVIVLSPADFDAEVQRGHTSFAFERIDDNIKLPVPPALDRLESEQTAAQIAANEADIDRGEF